MGEYDTFIKKLAHCFATSAAKGGEHEEARQISGPMDELSVPAHQILHQFARKNYIGHQYGTCAIPFK
jgi:hypothetical protein